MRHLLQTLHILFAIFAVGPLVHAATTASRGVRQADGHAVATAARTVRIYGYASLLVALFGFGLVQPKYDHQFSDTWIWLSVVLYVVALAVLFAVLQPSLQRAATALAEGSSAQPLNARIAASGGVIGLLFAVIVVLMVYKPGS
ncbi:MAG: hypothetical protein QOK10_77 [Pseudonocardiales bacterium]|jgi:uncharacterized membrane protein|nr:hypothetical protein [Pseudonocardiales bacterium]